MCIRDRCEDYDVTYRINGKPVASADVTLGMEDIDVDIINTPRIDVYKRQVWDILGGVRAWKLNCFLLLN